MNSTPPAFETVLSDVFRIPGFRPGQKEIIASVLAKKDTLAVLPTGGGKSLCYQFPAVYTQKLVVVISPLIALMKDQVANLRRAGIRAGCLHSGQTLDEKREIFAEMNRKGSYLLYLSPERVQKEGFQKWIREREIALFAVDEAHCVSQWGHDFREEYSALKILKEIKPDVPVLALTASATPEVLADVAKNLHLKQPQKFVYGFYRPNLYYQVEVCMDEESKMLMLLQAIRQTPEGRVLVYCGTRRITEELASSLSQRFSQVGFYHAGLSSEQRTKIQEAYMQGGIRILVATNAFGMGIDQPNVRLVVHFQMPANIDSLYQEMGRAGRDGNPSTCVMLYSRKDKGLQSYFIQSSDAPKNIKDSRWRNLEALVNYSEGSECRHGEILTYYRDTQRIRSCGHCDVCDESSSRKIRAFQSTTQLIKAEDRPRTSLKKSSSRKSSRADLVLDPVQESRFQVLKKWRKEKALELDMPAFVVFSDQTLKHLAIQNPQNIEELKKIYGIGEQKLEKFGWDLLAELSNS